MAIIAIQSVTPVGLDPTLTAVAGGGDKVKPGERVFIYVKNDAGASVTVTVDDTITAEPAGATAFDPDLEVVIAPSTFKLIGPISDKRFRGTDGYADITYSSPTSVTIAALRL